MTHFSTSQYFWQAAEERSQWWRLVLGIIVVATVTVVFSAVVFGTSTAWVDVFEIVRSTTPLAMAILFISFLGTHIGLIAVLLLLHNRGYGSLLGPDRRVVMQNFVIGFFVVVPVFLFSILIVLVEPYFLPETMVPPVETRAFAEWISWTPVAVVLILIQVTAEEMVFRGYLLQQLRARSRSFWIYAFIPSLLFGMLHYDPQTFGETNAVLYVLMTTIFGLVGCVVTLKTGNLGAMIGVHYAINLSVVFWGFKDMGSGFSLFMSTAAPHSAYGSYTFAVQIALIVLTYALWRWWVSPPA